MLRSLSSRLVGLALVATTVVAVQATTAAEASTSSAMYGAPKAGSCYSISGKAVAKRATSARAHSCRKAHTLWVAGVARVPASMDITTADTAPPLIALVMKACGSAVGHKIGKLGRSWGLSAYNWYWFFPTAQQQRGAHWISCEVGITAGKNRLVTTRQVKPTHMSMNPRNNLRLCGTKTYYFTNCARAHAFRATYAQVYRATDATYQAKAARLCTRHLRGHGWMYAHRYLHGHRWVVSCLQRNHH